MYKTTVRERPERQPDRFNVTFKRCSQGYLMAITDVLSDKVYWISDR